jgi:hypothetical protein
MKPGIFPFTASGDTSTAVDPNSKEWGSAGLMLPRPSCRKNPSKYTLRGADGGTLFVLADCNRGRSSIQRTRRRCTSGLRRSPG